jgi:hypothetical protein
VNGCSGAYFKIEPDGIRAAKRTWKDDCMQCKTTINLFKTGFYAWPTTPAAAPAAVELAQMVPNLSSPDRHVEAWREARARTRAGESAGAVAQDVATRWDVSFSRSKAYKAKKLGSTTPKRPGGAPRIAAELEQALATMVEQLNTMDFTVFKEDVKGAADAMINGTAFEQYYLSGSKNMHRAPQHRGCDNNHSRIKKKCVPYS